MRVISNSVDLLFTDNKYSYESVVIMEEDPAVIDSATYLYERNPSASTLLWYDKGTLFVLRGSCFFPSKEHGVTLVGHGSKVARFVSILKTLRTFGHLSTISLTLYAAGATSSPVPQYGNKAAPVQLLPD